VSDCHPSHLAVLVLLCLADRPVGRGCIVLINVWGLVCDVTGAGAVRRGVADPARRLYAPAARGVPIAMVHGSITTWAFAISSIHAVIC
jgi:hypothetical protein